MPRRCRWAASTAVQGCGSPPPTPGSPTCCDGSTAGAASARSAATRSPAGCPPTPSTTCWPGFARPGSCATWPPPTCWPPIRGRRRTHGLRGNCRRPSPAGRQGGGGAPAGARVDRPGAVPGGGAGGGGRARRQSAVVVEGANRVGTPLAAVLAASGVGRVHVRDRGATRAGEAIVGGASAADEGRPRALAAADAVRRASPLTDLRPLPPGQSPDLVVLCRPWAAVDPLSAAWQRAGTPHLVATVRGETGIVGPFVLPGQSSCLRCAEAWRRDDDPAWPRLAAQLAGDDSVPSGATIACLSTALTAAVQVLAHLDGTAGPVTVNGTVELRPPSFQPRLRRWAPHPDCACGAARGGAGGKRGQWAGD